MQKEKEASPPKLVGVKKKKKKEVDPEPEVSHESTASDTSSLLNYRILP